MKQYLKRLNWSGWSVTYLLCILAGFANENCNNWIEKLVIGLSLGFIFSLFPLFAGMDEKPKKYYE